MRDWLFDWTETWYSLRFAKTWRDRRRALACMLTGHRRVVAIPHNKICETPWKTDHARENEGVVERFCRYCDSGYLSSRGR